MSLLAFQTADIYQVQAFRGHEKQYMRLASAWSVVFLLAVTTSFFTKSGDEFSRAWLGAFTWSDWGPDRFPRACSCWCADGPSKAALTAEPSWSAAMPAARP